MSLPQIRFLLSPFIIVPLYLTNLLKNFPNLDILDSNNFWSYDYTNNPLGGVGFMIIGGIFSLIIFKLLSSKKNKNQNEVFWFLFLFYTIGILAKALPGLWGDLQETINIDVGVGKGNLDILLTTLTMIFATLFILSKINKKINPKFILTEFLKFIFMIFEVLLMLFIGLIFLKTHLATGANLIDNVSRVLIYLFLIFLIFLLTEIFKDWLLQKIVGKDKK